MSTIFYSVNDRDNAESIPEEYDMIVKRIRESVKQIAKGEGKQVLILQTADDQFHEAVIDAPYDAYDNLLNAIGKDNTVIRLVCCWVDGSFDMPSYKFRRKLCELNSDNEKARMLLNGWKAFILKSIKDTMPNT